MTLKRLLILVAILCLPLMAHANPIGAGQACYKDGASNRNFGTDFFVHVSNCAETNRQNMYSAIGSLTQGNPAQTQAMLGMLQVENSCGGAQSNRASCNGTYTVAATCSGCTAFGAAQIIRPTWNGLVSGESKQYLISQLGGCGGTGAGLTNPQTTPNGTIRGQYEIFRQSLCGQRSPAPTDQRYYGSLVGVSLLMAKAHNRPADALARNASISGALTSAGLDANGVSYYATHNLGAGGGRSFLTALANNPNASVTTVLSSNIIKYNPGLYCGSRIRSGQTCPNPLTLQQAAQRMHNTLYSSSCMTNGLAALGMGAPQMGLVNSDGIVADASNSVVAMSGELAALEQAQNQGGAVSEEGQVSGYCSTSVNAEKPDSLESCPE